MANETKLTYLQVRDWFMHKRSQKKEANKRIFLPEKATKHLLKQYESEKFPSSDKMQEMANELQLEFAQIKSWFKTRRRKLGDIKSNFIPFKVKHVEYLNEKYKLNKNPTKQECEEMTKDIELNSVQIYRWFCDKRLKLKETKQNYYSEELNDYLNVQYEKNPYPDWKEREEMCKITKLNKNQLIDWFQNKRQKLKQTHATSTKRTVKPFSYTMSEENLFYLIKKFDENQRPTREEYKKLAKETKLTTLRIHKWFGKRRFEKKKKQ